MSDDSPYDRINTAEPVVAEPDSSPERHTDSSCHLLTETSSGYRVH